MDFEVSGSQQWRLVGGVDSRHGHRHDVMSATYALVTVRFDMLTREVTTR